MNDAEIELNHALESVTLIQTIRSSLSAPENHRGSHAALESLVPRIENLLHTTPPARLPATWPAMLAGLRVLASHRHCLTIAQGSAGDLVSERARLDVLWNDLRSRLRFAEFPIPETTARLRGELASTDTCDVTALAKFLLAIPLPTIYWRLRDERFPIRDDKEAATATTTAAALAPMVWVIAFLDNTPLATPQLLKADLLYPLVFRLRGLSWPEQAKALHLDLLTTCPSEAFSISKYILQTRDEFKGFEYQAELPGQITFTVAQSNPLNDLVFAIRAAFELPDSEMLEIPVIGHQELRLRIVSQRNHPLMSGNRRLDQHVEELLTKITKECPQSGDELNDLLPVLQTLTSLLAVYAQEAVFKGRNNVTEAEFQATVLHDLRVHLGTDVQEHPKQAGGFSDIRYNGVIVELKVERDNGDRQQICKNYSSQPTQYAGVEARQVSVVLVLDLTPKDRPPGDIRNDILLVDVETHGGTDGSKSFPSKAVVFVVNGNMKNPSDYSA